MARGVGTRLALEPEELDEVVRAAELHDVGKMAVPDEVLNKPGPLTDEEWNFMRQHTIVGERILSAAPALTPVARLVRASHERWDGAGYPDGLAGQEIPLGARIVAVCDAFHAMTRDRALPAPLRSTRRSGSCSAAPASQFDPEVVKAFVDELSAMAVRTAPRAGSGPVGSPPSRVTAYLPDGRRSRDRAPAPPGPRRRRSAAARLPAPVEPRRAVATIVCPARSVYPVFSPVAPR